MSRCKSEGECRNPGWCRSANECHRDSVPKSADQPAPNPRTDAMEYLSSIAAAFGPGEEIHFDARTWGILHGKIADAVRELSAANAEAERLREAMQQAHDAMEAFTDPDGNMPADTGEFRELKAAMLSAEKTLVGAK